MEEDLLGMLEGAKELKGMFDEIIEERRISDLRDELGIMYVNDVAKVLGISETSAYKMFNDAQFPKCTIGKSHFVTRDALNEYLKIRR